MAKVKPNDLIKGLSGSIGRLVFRRMPDGSVVVSGAPDFRRRKFSKGQQEHQQRFREASVYARQAAKTQPIYAKVGIETLKTAYNIALSDWFNPPVIHQVKQRAGSIFAEAGDNVMVTKILFTVLDEDGKIAEQGEGTKGEGDWWEYIPGIPGKRMVVEASDTAGNVTKFDYEQE